jgi:FeS assembly protein IscX
MKWTDINDIAIELSDAHPAIDPLKINFVDLRDWVMALPDFNDDPKHCGTERFSKHPAGLDRRSRLSRHENP